MNTSKLVRSITGALILIAPFTASAEDYTLTLNAYSTWDTASWSPSGIPGAGDTATITTDNSVQFLYLNGDQAVTSLTRGSAGGTGTLRILNSDASNTDATLNISGTFTAQKSMSLRSLDSTGHLTVNSQDLVIDSGARFLVAHGAAGLENVTLHVSGTTTIQGGNSAFELREFGTANTSIHLGDVVFADTLSGGTPGITIYSHELHVRSLTSNGAGSIIGSGTGGKLVIDGTTGSNTFGSKITGTVRVEKTGGSTQIFSGEEYTYSGGTLINSGILSASNSDSGLTGRSALGSGSVVVANHGTLAGRGSVRLGEGNYITVQEGGTIAPSADGQAGFSTLLLNNSNSGEGTILKMEEGSAFTFKVDDAGNSDLITFGFYTAGDVLFEGGAITLNITGTLAEGHTYELFNFKSGSAQFGALTNSGLSSGLQAGTGFDGFTPTFHYDETGYGGTGVISMTVEAIPEPGTVALFVLSLGLGLTLCKKIRRM